MTLVADWNASVNVPFQRMRQQLLDGALQEGVVGASDLMVVQRGAGANQSVDVGAGFAWVQIDTGTRNGIGHVTNDAVANVTVTAANGSNPRIDQIILRWNDTSIPTGSGNVPTLEVLTGTATAGATLANRTGAAALPSDCLRLADLLIPTSSTTISNTQIRDRRPWARGANWSFLKSAGNFTGFASFTTLDPPTAPTRIECSGAPVKILFAVTYTADASPRLLQIRVQIDGTAVLQEDISVAASQTASLQICGQVTPELGSHVFAFQLASAAAVGTVTATTTQPVTMSVQEVVRQNAANNTTTSG